MYNNFNNNASGNRFNNGVNRGRKNNFRQSFAKSRGPRIKKLDQNLFIKKASDSLQPENHLSNILFSDFAITDKLKRNIADHEYTHPTFIQEKAIPPLLEGRDVIGIAKTGTGKTAAFLIPLVNKISQNRNERALIVVPTRELAMQILDELKIFTKGMDLEAALCIGGASMSRQEKMLHHSPHFVIGTPGRLKDLIHRRKLDLLMFRNIVLDEVDRMLDIGFINDVKYFISLLPKNRQSLFFSATVSGQVSEILASFVSNAVTVRSETANHIENIEQDIIPVRAGSKKVDILHDLLILEEFEKVLIFGRTKWGIEKLTKELIARGFKVLAIHGNKTQGQRKKALEQFKNGDIGILLATDVASRGLDIENVTHVINYDEPESRDDYIHRIGRTGRAGKKGMALTFVDR